MTNQQPAPRRALQLALAALLLIAAGEPRLSASEEPPAAAAELLRQAQEHFGWRRYDQAAEAARRVVALGAPPKAVAQAASLLGLTLYRHWSLGLDDASEERLKRLLGAPGGPRVPPIPGDELLAEAAEAFRRAVELDSEGGNSVRFNLALVLFYLQRDDEAAAVTAEYVRQGGKHPEALALHACLHAAKAGELERVGGEVSRPEKIDGTNPSYTDLGRAVGVEGIVILEAVIDKAGNVRCLRPLKRLPLGMTESAMNAVGGWKFKPATLAGEPVKVYYTLTVNFMIDRRSRPPRPG